VDPQPGARGPLRRVVEPWEAVEAAAVRAVVPGGALSECREAAVGAVGGAHDPKPRAEVEVEVEAAAPPMDARRSAWTGRPAAAAAATWPFLRNHADERTASSRR
jgi:hypothetical protein